jgi:hypothetical protein
MTGQPGAGARAAVGGSGRGARAAVTPRCKSRCFPKRAGRPRRRAQKSVDQIFKPDDQTIAYVGIHALTGGFQPFAAQLWPVVQQIPHPLFMNQVGPLGPVEVGQGHLHQQISQRRRREDKGIIQSGERRHA